MTNLNDEQQRAVNTVYGPVLVLAGPGSGKTHTLTERIRHMIEDVRIKDSEILVITFSKKAALEMKERFDKLTSDKAYRVYFGTFHAIFYSILKNHMSFDKSSILTEKSKLRILKRVYSNLHIQIKDDRELIDILERISGYKNAEDKESFLSIECEEEKKEDFVRIYEKYVYICKVENKLDFDDMLFLCRDLLSKNIELRKIYQKMYKYILVDEFQDINRVQYEVLNYLSGENDNIFAVGDDDQSIYGFRGSKPEIMREFMERQGCRVINLSRNYRSDRSIVDISKKLISRNMGRIEKEQIAVKNEINIGSVIIENCNNALSEAEYVIAKIKEIREKTKLCEVAVLFRTIRCIDILKEKMSIEGISYTTNVISDNYYDIEWVKDIVTYLRISTGQRNINNIVRILNKPDRELDRDVILQNNKDDVKYIKLLSDIERISNMSSFAAVNFILRGIGYESYLFEKLSKKGYTRDRIKGLIDELLEKARIFENIKEWLDQIDCVSESCNGTDSTENRVNLLTAHASKGLEFDTVFIVGLQEGIFPHEKSSSNYDLEEERRLLYVAMTRARKKLYIIGRGEYKHGKRISRFIDELV